jgi:dipeptidyl aminopeptidase/acylaminoacyl peptidase
MGDPATDGDHIRAVSPANLAARVHIPMLLIHGADDTVVPYEQSQEMNQRLQAAGKNVHFVTLDHEDHWMSDGSTRIQMLREQETFLAQYLGSSAHPAAVAQTAAH